MHTIEHAIFSSSSYETQFCALLMVSSGFITQMILYMLKISNQLRRFRHVYEMLSMTFNQEHEEPEWIGRSSFNQTTCSLISVISKSHYWIGSFGIRQPLAWNSSRNMWAAESLLFFPQRTFFFFGVLRERDQARKGDKRPSVTKTILVKRDAQIDAEQSSGQPSLLRDVYKTMQCPGSPCENKDGYFWQDPHGKYITNSGHIT